MIVSGDISLPNADLAEEFDVNARSEPGTVLVLGEDDRLEPSSDAYDTRVIGVVSGAGAWKPALVLDRKQTDGRQRVALVGKAYCLADADVHPIGAGDLLPLPTRSGTR